MNILLDLDGTIFKTAPCIISAVNRLRRELGLNELEDNEIIKSIGKKTNAFLKDTFPSSINTNDIREIFRLYEHEEVVNHGELFPGTLETLEKIVNDRNHLYICSNGSIEYIELILNKFDIKEYFDEIYSAKSYESKVDMVKEIIKQRQGSCIIIGDTASDIEAGFLNHIPSIAACYGYGDVQELNHATFYANSTDEIFSFVECSKVFYKCYEVITKRESKVVGINGVDTSGKTTFARNFSRFLQALDVKNQVISIDDFHNPLKVRRTGVDENTAYYTNAFNYNQLINELLLPISKGEVICKDVLCLTPDTDAYDANVHYDVDKDTLVLLEGLLLFRTPIIDYLDLKIFIDIDFNEVLKRARARDCIKYGEAFLMKYVTRYIPVQKRYLSDCKPKEVSDIVINNQDFLSPKIAIN